MKGCAIHPISGPTCSYLWIDQWKMNHDGKWSSSSDRKTCFSQGRLYHQYNVHQYLYTTTLVQAPSNTHLSTSPPSSSEFCSHGNNGELRMNEKEMIIHSISSSHCLSCVSSRFLNFFAKFSDCRWRLPNFVSLSFTIYLFAGNEWLARKTNASHLHLAIGIRQSL